MSVHPVPQGPGVHGGSLGSLNPHRTLQHGLHPRLDLGAHAAAAPGHVRHVTGGHPDQVRQFPHAQAQLPGPLPDVGAASAGDAAHAVGQPGGRNLPRAAQGRLDPGLDAGAHVPLASRRLGHVAVGHAHHDGQGLEGQALPPGPLPDDAALAGDGAALAVDDALPRDLAQDRPDPFRHHGGPGPVPVGHRAQVAVVDAHQGGQLFEGEAVPPGRRPELALGLALVCRLVTCLSRALLDLRGIAGALAVNLHVVNGPGVAGDLRGVLLVVAGAGHVASS